MAEELRLHVEALVERNIEAGLSREEARRAAVKEFGGVDQIEERCRDEERLMWLEQLGADLRYAARQMRRAPIFSLVTVMTLALGIGANTAFFGVLSTTLYRPLPYPEPDRLVHLDERTLKGNWTMPVSYPDFLDWKRLQTTFSSISIYLGDAMSVQREAATDRVGVLFVDHDFLRTLGYTPALGRDFTEADDRVGVPRTVLLTADAWKRRFDSDASVIGKVMNINGQPVTIVGVLPETYRFFRESEFLVPLGPWVEDRFMQMRESHSASVVVGRLKPGVNLNAARAEMDAIASRIEKEYPKSNGGIGARLISLRDYLVGDARQGQLLLMSAVALVLLIACVNVANLVLARSLSRDREIAVRAALGAGRGRLVRQFFTECLLLSFIGGTAGLAVAATLSNALVSLIPGGLLSFGDPVAFHFDWRMLGFGFAVTLATGVLFGLAPAWQLRRVSLVDSLKDRSASGASAGHLRLADLLVVAQVGLATVLVIAAGLVLRSLWTLSSEPLGFESENVLSVRLGSPSGRMGGSLPRAGAFYEEAAQRLGRLPGVEAAAATSNLAFGYNDSHNQFRVADRPVPDPASYPSASYRIVTQDYFRAMGIPVLQGRVFTGQEPPLAPKSEKPDMKELLEALRQLPMDGVVTRSFAQRYWPGENPIGKRLLLGPPDIPMSWITVVGVVADSTQDELGQKNHEEFYLSIRQLPAPMEFGLIVRGRGDPAALAESVRAELRRFTSTEPVYDMQVLSSRVAQVLSGRTFQTRLVAGFAAVALLLAAIGLFGVLAFNVGRRTREFGVRLALGASPTKIVRSVFVRGFALVLPGLALGLLAASWCGRYVQNQLYGIEPTDLVTYTTASGALLVAAVLACWLPARRASRVDPIEALRTE